MLKRLLFLFVCIMIMAVAAFAQTPDPGLPGTHTVIKAEYDLGDLAFTPPPAASFPANMEVRGSVHYPSDLSSGPFPVIVFLHGRHETCFQTSDPTNTSSDWPCLTGWESITSYEGYDYLANTMASHGYIVISISCNAINAIDGGLPDDGMNARGVLVQHHLDLWNTWNTTGGAPFGTTFVGKLNMQNIGTMGHSRGGEGVIYNAEYNRSLGSPYGIKAILTLAPVDFHRHVVNGIPLMDVAPYCDGDVSDLEGVHFYDDARYNDTTDESPKHIVLLMGANHDFFNTVWTPGSYIAGGADDWADYGYNPLDPHCGTTVPSRFDTTKQKAALNAYLPAFFRLYIGKEKQFNPILEVKDVTPPASTTLTTSDVFVSYHPARVDRLDVNRTDSLSRATTNSLGGAVSSSGLVSSAICGGGLGMPVCDAGVSADQLPHRGTAGIKGLGQMRVRWNDTTDWYQNAVPAAYQNVSAFKYIGFRVSVDFKETAAGTDLDYSVQLIDSLGDTSNQVISSYSHTLFYEPGTEPSDLPKEVFNTVAIPDSAFTGVNLTKIRFVRFRFNRSVAGAVIFSDLAFFNPLCGNFASVFTDSVTHTGYKVLFTNASHSVDQDSLTYLWKFGDPSSGTNDTTTAKNPFHNYTAAGTYHPCLYVTSYRKNGLSCMDSICNTVVVPPHVGVAQQTATEITIIPNPAKDYIRVVGAASSDQFTLVDMYGKTVVHTGLANPVVQLPPYLAAGMYYAVVTTADGRFYQKILIDR